MIRPAPRSALHTDAMHVCQAQAQPHQGLCTCASLDQARLGRNTSSLFILPDTRWRVRMRNPPQYSTRLWQPRAGTIHMQCIGACSRYGATYLSDCSLVFPVLHTCIRKLTIHNKACALFDKMVAEATTDDFEDETETKSIFTKSRGDQGTDPSAMAGDAPESTESSVEPTAASGNAPSSGQSSSTSAGQTAAAGQAPSAEQNSNSQSTSTQTAAGQENSSSNLPASATTSSAVAGANADAAASSSSAAVCILDPRFWAILTRLRLCQAVPTKAPPTKRTLELSQEASWVRFSAEQYWLSWQPTS